MTRRMVGRLAVAVVAVVTVVAGSPSPAPVGAGDRSLAGTAIPAVATVLHLDSAPGDHVGAGRTWTYVPAEADFTVAADGGTATATVAGDATWDVVLRPDPEEGVLTEGRREGPDVLAVTGDGRGCGDDLTNGWYEVDDVAWSGSTLVGLRVRFAQWCDGEVDESRGLVGELRWDGTAALPGAPTPVGPAPAAFWRPPAGLVPTGAERNHLVMASDPGDFVGRGLTHAHTGFGVQRFQGGLSLVHPETDVTWHLRLRESNRAEALEAGYYPKLLGHPVGNPVRGDFSITGGGRACNVQTAEVVIDQIDARDDTYADVALRFEQHCEHRTPALRGQVVWQAPVAAGTPGPPTGVTATATAEGAVVAWTPPTGTVTGYRIVTYRDGTAVGADTVVPAGTSSHRIPLTEAGSWSFKVVATNAAGPGLRSAMSPSVGQSPLRLGPFADVAAFVAQQHLDLLGRPATPAEIAAASTRLLGRTVTPGAYVAALRDRPEVGGVRAPIVRLYAAAFLRPVDVDGLDHWAGRRRAGTSLRSVAQAFTASPEMRALYGRLTNAAFVDRVYRNVLGRAPDAAGHAYWTGRLDAGTSRGEVLLGFSEAPENRTRRAAVVDVTLLTTALLRRAPTAIELSVGGDPEGLALHTLTRAEYALRFPR